EFDKAIEQYTQAKAKSSPGEVNERATHKLGWSYFRLGKFDSALEAFRSHVQAYPEGAVHADGLFMQAECLYQLKSYEEALPLFSAASQTTPSKPQMQVLTLLHGGQCAAELQQWEESLRYFDQIPDKFPKTPYLADALGKRGWAKQKMNRLDEAIQDYEQAVTSSRGEAGAYAQYMIGEIQFERKQHKEAIRSFLRVMYGYGGENAVKEVKHWQAMAGYEAGRCAEVQKQLANAKKYYAFVVGRFGEHELAPKAKGRLDALDKL
ncbi:MAG: tetratricopeptide repeat protein, partial [Pirellulales bacterium]